MWRAATSRGTDSVIWVTNPVDGADSDIARQVRKVKDLSRPGSTEPEKPFELAEITDVGDIPDVPFKVSCDVGTAPNLAVNFFVGGDFRVKASQQGLLERYFGGRRNFLKS